MRLKKLDATGKPYRIFAEYLDSGAIDQFVSVMEHDAIVRGALMPDAHQGYSLPVGGVVAAQDMVFPAFVGYDIGCGVGALPTSFRATDVRVTARAIFEGIYRRVPVGFEVNPHPVDCGLNADDLSVLGRSAFDVRKGFRSIGSLGGGNHFIEVGADESERVWIIIHSGSRGAGHGVAQKFMQLASGDGKAREGCFGLRADTDLGRSYANDQAWCLEFALANREEILARVLSALSEQCEGEGDWSGLINRNHNHAEYKDGLWIHRKGATHAEDGMLGVIPGNMRDGSFIVRGKGNPESLRSSSHGAGRVLGRAKAKACLSASEFEKTMRESGVVARVGQETLDESPMAYKDIFEVMQLQSELVDVLHHVRPIVNVKG
ncbi:MAG: RNA-splicing ligase RtcB [Gammaproteobacteria bacterium RIFOXYA12_FULL_61_12]|nr:MAG: RNA-splicing ligase RtcB [Gammaproteobacteria bacterium RIFOXYD12_FULL_61_37]OGT92489.1 MAG: RNA-splicing ligase RtcB [Gammaproteobacteria bacterium RIFOXYA12_FULL_61_12]